MRHWKSRVYARRPPRPALGCEALEPRQLLAGDLRITEFVAANSAGLRDGDGNRSDWIEIQNLGQSPADLDGYFLTDNLSRPRQWQFPARTLAPGESLLVFATAPLDERGLPLHDYVDAAGYLHANFRLDRLGESLVLFEPDGQTVVSAMLDYPEQFDNVAYGLPQARNELSLVGPGSPAQWLVPDAADAAAIGATWIEPAFDDSAWQSVSLAVGFDTEVDASQDENIALNAAVSPSDSTWGSFPASNITDGNRATFTHPLTPTETFFYDIDLGQTATLDRIQIAGRGDGCCTDRLTNYRVSLFANDNGDPGALRWSTVVRGDGSNSGVGGVDVLTADLDPGGTFAGQWLRIEKLEGDGSNYWPQIAEVEVFPFLGYGPQIETDVAADMLGVNASAYLRTTFNVAAPEEVNTLTLGLQYDDGFVAFLNGQEIARENAPAGMPAFDAAATAEHDGRTRVEFAIAPELLVAGDNVLAFQALNDAVDGEDFLIAAELIAGRIATDSAPAFLPQPSPGALNGQGVLGIVGQPTAHRPRGFYDAPLDVTIASTTPGASLVYTTDGTPPAADNGVRIDPDDALSTATAQLHVTNTTTLRVVSLLEDWAPSRVETFSYIFLQDVLTQPAAPAGLPSTWDGKSQAPIPADYEMDPDVVTDPAYADEILAGLRAIPTISLVLSDDAMFGQENGIYVNSAQRGSEWERTTSVEIIEPDGSSFQADSGIRIHGFSWRNHANTPKHSFRLEFSDEHGPRKLEYPLFPDSPVDKFDSIVLRAQGGRAWAGPQDPVRAQYLRDTFARDLAREMGATDGHAALVHLYINGMYWGLYNPVERPDAQMGEEYFGGSDEDYDALNRRTSTLEVIDGDLDRYNEMMAIANAALAAGETTDQQWQELQRYVAIDDFIDWMLRNQYVTNRDGLTAFEGNNQRAIGSREGDAQFRFFVWDMEYSLWDANDNNNIAPGLNDPALAGTQNPQNHAWTVYNALRQHPEFRLRYADHVQQHLFHGGALTPEAAAATWETRAESIEQAIVAESARWGDAKREQPYTRDVEWQAERTRLLTEYFPVRAGVLVEQLREVGLYTAIDGPEFNQHGGEISADFLLSITAAAGDIYYTLDGSDPRLPGGEIATAARRFDEAFSLADWTTIRARAFAGGEWSALTEATFRTPGPPGVRINEFVADNEDGLTDADGDAADWIEIYNRTSVALNLSGWSLTDDPTLADRWTFPDVTLAAGGYLVVFASGKDRADPSELHTDFQIDTGGDQLTLLMPDGQMVVDQLDPDGTPFADQLEDVSYGWGSLVRVHALVTADSPATVLIPSDDALGLNWTGGAEPFDDSVGAGWQTATAAIGFDQRAATDPVVTPDPALGWNADAPAEGGSWEPLFGDQRSWAFTVAPEWIDASGLRPGIHAAYRFDGDENVTAASFQGLGETGSASFEMWFRPASLSGGDQILFETGGINGVSFTLTDDLLRFGTSNSSETPDFRELLYTLSPDEAANFVQVVGVIDTENAQTRLYVNGAPAGVIEAATALWTGGNGAGLAQPNTAAGGYASGSEFGHGKFTGEMAVFNFNDAALTDEQVGARFESIAEVDYADYFTSDLAATMFPTHSAAFLRVPFDVASDAEFDRLLLDVQFDDGFVAWLNGVEVARRNASDPISFDSMATIARSDAQAVAGEQNDLTSHLSTLHVGQNILAIAGLNVSADDDDFLVAPRLTAISLSDDQPLYFPDPTPGAENGEGFLGQAAALQFSHERGFYREAFDVAIATPTSSAAIYYTLDGSAPTPENGSLYTGPVHVATTATLRAQAFADNYLPAKSLTHTYLFLADVANQPNDPVGFPSTWAGRPADYEMDPEVVGLNNLFNDLYRDTIVDDLLSLPSMSLVMDLDDLFGPTGIYENPAPSGLAWERPTSVELISADGSEPGFQIDAGVRIQGGSSRSVDYPKHSFRLEFREVYDEGKLVYPLFENQPYGDSAADEFDELVLRGAFNNSWTHWHFDQAPRGQYTRDQWVRDLQLAMGQLSTHGRYVHLYLNGVYWGIYNLGERPAAPFQETYFGGDKDNYDVINSRQPIDGDTVAWNEMQALANAGLDTPEAYGAIQQYLDVEAFIDYMILNFYVGNADWDGHNWIAARPREPGGQFKFYAWDSEFAIALGPGDGRIGDEGEQAIINNDRTNLNSNGNPTRLYQQLRANEEFRLLFADRVQQHLRGAGPLTPENAASIWTTRAAQVDRAVVAESARWGDYRRDVHSNVWPADMFELFTRDEHFLAQQAFILEDYLPVRTEVVLQQFRDRGLFPLIEPPSFTQSPGELPPGSTVELAAAVGEIYYTLDGSDPREVGGAIAAAAMLWDGTPIPVDEQIHVRTRAVEGGEWSAINEATFFEMQPAADSLRIAEVNYHPFEPTVEEMLAGFGDAEAFEFIELVNIGDTAIDLAGVALIDGVGFTFGATMLAAGERVVVVRDAAAFAARYGTAGVTVAGQWDAITSGGGLSNGGEQIVVVDALGAPFLDFTYDDANGWPTRADGDGSSLEMIDPASDPTDNENWRPSSEFGGSPGAAGEGPRGDVVINEVLAHTDLPQFDAIELFNTTNAAIDLSGWYLSDATDYRKFRIPAGTLLAAGEYLVFDERDFNASAGVDPNDFALSAARGDEVHLLEANAADQLVRFVDDVALPASKNGEAFGRALDATGVARFAPQQRPTLGAANGPVRVGPILVSEVHYNPADPDGLGGVDPNDLEFVEIHNPTDLEVPLVEWQLQGGVDFAFAADAVLPAGGVLVVVPFDPQLQAALADQFRAHYGLDGAVALAGPYTGVLDNGGETVRLSRPDDPPLDEPLLFPRLLEDELRYDDIAPWPLAADGGGSSLARTASNAWGADPASWQAAAPSPGVFVDNGPALRVVSLHISASGVAIELPRSIDLDQLSLYVGASGAQGAADVTLVGAAGGPIVGSLAWDGRTNTLRFVATGGTLPADHYTLTLASRGDGLTTSAGALLDGGDDGAAGGDFVAEFDVNATAAPVLAIDDFARGPDQPVELGASGGLPVRLSDGANVTSLGFTLFFDPALLSIDAVAAGADLPNDWSAPAIDFVSPGRVRVTASGITALAAGAQHVVTLTASVPATAARGAAQALLLDQQLLNGGLLPSMADEALHAAVYFGDVTNSGDYSALDASLIARATIGLDTGFDELPAIDPLLVADVTGNGALSALDASFVARVAVGLDQAEIPPLPGAPIPPPPTTANVSPNATPAPRNPTLARALISFVAKESVHEKGVATLSRKRLAETTSNSAAIALSVGANQPKSRDLQSSERRLEPAKSKPAYDHLAHDQHFAELGEFDLRQSFARRTVGKVRWMMREIDADGNFEA
ncbi:MAG: lamin tail domain-containing protein [Planctomycetales bacterium]|nr:lamin tail domain-containing protein [Planctomycetales bacterium]